MVRSLVCCLVLCAVSLAQSFELQDGAMIDDEFRVEGAIDLEGDGQLERIVRSPRDISSDRISAAFEVWSDGAFGAGSRRVQVIEPPVPNPFMFDHRYVGTGRVTRDGIDDLVTSGLVSDSVGNKAFVVLVHPGQASGTFGPFQVWMWAPWDRFAPTPLEGALADFDGDGWADLVPPGLLAGDRMILARNSGTGFDLPPVVLGSISSATPFDPRGRMRVGDVNGDGQLDVITFEEDFLFSVTRQRLAVALNDGLGGFLPRVTILTRPSNPVDAIAKIMVGDVNGDGADDAVLEFENFPPSGPNPTIRVCLGLLLPSTAGLSAPILLAPPSTLAQPSLMAVGDFDGDQRAGILLTALDATGSNRQLFLVRPTLQGTWSASAPMSAPWPDSVERMWNGVAADIDTDGDLDFLSVYRYGERTKTFGSLTYTVGLAELRSYHSDSIFEGSCAGDVNPSLSLASAWMGGGALNFTVRDAGSFTPVVFGLSLAPAPGGMCTPLLDLSQLVAGTPLLATSDTVGWAQFRIPVSAPPGLDIIPVHARAVAVPRLPGAAPGWTEARSFQLHR